jgi:uncharacterized integral membrane protein
MFKKIKQLFGIVPKDQVEEVFSLADMAATTTVKTMDAYVAPVRKSILQRFPVLFGLMATIGAAAVILGIEQLILKYKILVNHPELILLIGISMLAFTGRLYKKLSE